MILCGLLVRGGQFWAIKCYIKLPTICGGALFSIKIVNTSNTP